MGLLIGQSAHLAHMGLAGQIALCAESVGEGLQNFADLSALQNTAVTLSVITSGGFTRHVFAIAVPGMADSQIQLAATSFMFNILRDLCGPGWLPVAATIASSAPSNLRPCLKFIRAPLCFDSVESSLIFATHWLGRSLSAVDPLRRRQIDEQLPARQAAFLHSFALAVRRIVRRQLIFGNYSMDSVATSLGVHRRTLGRQLQRYDTHYNELLDSVQRDVACQLLRVTGLPVQRIAESLHYSSPANFATAFRRWTGITPTDYRRSAN